MRFTPKLHSSVQESQLGELHASVIDFDFDPHWSLPLLPYPYVPPAPEVAEQLVYALIIALSAHDMINVSYGS